MTTAPVIVAPAVGEGLHFPKNAFGSYTISVTANPVAAIRLTQPLPEGLNFQDNGNNTATISGTALVDGKAGNGLRANNGISPQAQERIFINIPHSNPAINSASFAVIAQSPTDNVMMVGAFAAIGDQPSMQFSATGIPPGMQVTTSGILKGHCNVIPSSGYYKMGITCKNNRGQDFQTFYLFVVGTGSGPKGQFAYPDPSFAIALAYALGARTWDGQSRCYVVPGGVNYGDLGIDGMEVKNADFYTPTFLHLDPGALGETALKATQAIQDIDNVTLTNVHSYGARPANATGYHADTVNQHGFHIVSSNNCTLNNCQSFNAGGDALCVVGDYQNGFGPCDNLTVNTFYGENTGRQGSTFGFCSNSTINDATYVNTAEGDLDMEADAGQVDGGVGCSNVTFNRMTGHGPRLIEDLQGPIFFNDCNFQLGIPMYGSAAHGGQLVTFTRCTLAGLRGSSPITMSQGPGRILMDRCTLGHVPGTLHPAPYWDVADGANLTLRDCTWDGPDGVTSNGGTVTIQHSSVPSFVSPASMSCKQGVTLTAPFVVTLAGFPTPTLTHTGSLPAGLVWYGNAIIGTPTASGGYYTITLHATNSHGSTDQTFIIGVAPNSNAPAFTSPAAATITQQMGQNVKVTAVGAPTPTLTTTGTFPTGMSFDPATGILGGNPTQTGTFTPTFHGHNSIGDTDQPFTLTVVANPNVAPTFTTPASVTLTAGQSTNSFTVKADGTPTPTISATGLPLGLLFIFNTLAGTPTTPGTYSVHLTATNVAGSVTQTLVVTVDVATSAPWFYGNANIVGTKGSVLNSVLAIGGTPAPTVICAGTLPAGISFANGVFSGTPSVTGTFNVTLVATNSVDHTTLPVSILIATRRAAASGQHLSVV